MSVAEIMYRARQFSSAQRAAPSAWGMEATPRWLNPAQMARLGQIQPTAQAHSLSLRMQLESQLSDIPAAMQQDLMVARPRQDLQAVALLGAGADHAG